MSKLTDRLKMKFSRTRRWVADLRREAVARDAALRLELERMAEEIAGAHREAAVRQAELRADIGRLAERLVDSHREAAVREAELRAERDRMAERLAALEERGRETITQLEAGASALLRANGDKGRADQRRDGQIALLERVVATGLGLFPVGAAIVAAATAGVPTVSVIMPVHNRADLIVAAIESVRAQVFPSWELIVIDDGSTDGLDRVRSAFAEDRRIRWIAQPRGGVSAARNAGLARAEGAWIAYLDSDNVWYPRFLSEMMTALGAAPETDVAYGVLATAEHGLGDRRFLFQPFDRERLLAENFIDVNVLVHRRSLLAERGGFDESLDRMVDWDLVLRYTEAKPALAVAVLGACYRSLDSQRITDTALSGPNAVAIRRKWYPPRGLGGGLRVLYVVWHYPQLSETYIETEIRMMLEWGVHIEVWRHAGVAAPYPPSVPVHSGTLEDAVRETRPDLIQVHWLGFAMARDAELARFGLPVTVRLHGFDTTPEGLEALLAKPWLRRIYAFPAQVERLGRTDPKIKVAPAAFDTRLFQPSRDKDPRLVVRAGTALPSKDIERFFRLSKKLPDFRFVFAGIVAKDVEAYVDTLVETRDRMQAPVELVWNLPRDEAAELLGRAGIYFHTIKPEAAPLGMPVSIAEAMATGALVIHRRSPEFDAYVGEAGLAYDDDDEAARIIAETQRWGADEWARVRNRAIDRAFHNHADALVYRTILEDWAAIVETA